MAEAKRELPWLATGMGSLPGRTRAKLGRPQLQNVRLLLAGTGRPSHQAINRGWDLGERAPGGGGEDSCWPGLPPPCQPASLPPCPLLSGQATVALQPPLSKRPQLGFHGLSKLQLSSLGAQDAQPLKGAKGINSLELFTDLEALKGPP